MNHAVEIAPPGQGESFRPAPAQVQMTFCATGKSGLGHLRRVVNVAKALRDTRSRLNLALLTNAPVEDLAAQGLEIYAQVQRAERADMASRLKSFQGPIVVDTAVVPGLQSCPGPLCLILRETRAQNLGQFRLEGGRPWDLILVPNPKDHWSPDPEQLPARKIVHTGWIYRSTAGTDNAGGPQETAPKSGAGPALPFPASHLPTVLVASGGGGKDETARSFRAEVDGLLARLRDLCGREFRVVQALGPLAPANAQLDQADLVFDPGGHLNETFDHADLAISTCGYNSVLELACSRTPTLLMPIARSIDDQALRARNWGPLLGHCHEQDAPEASLAWMARLLAQPMRRPAVPLPPSGAGIAAACLGALL